MAKIIQKFKGGSLSSTSLMESNDGEFFVRKTVSVLHNREYGFQRCYSQMKRIQRYSVLFPGLSPTLLDNGLDKDSAYFDIEYFPNAVNAHDSYYKEDDEYIVDTYKRMIDGGLKVAAGRAFHSDDDTVVLGTLEQYIDNTRLLSKKGG